MPGRQWCRRRCNLYTGLSQGKRGGSCTTNKAIEIATFSRRRGQQATAGGYMPVSSRKQAPQANFIFQGTIQKLKAAAMENVPVDDRTAVVRVDQVIESPKAAIFV